MKKSRFTESQIVAVLKEGAAAIFARRGHKKRTVFRNFPLDLPSQSCAGFQQQITAKNVHTRASF
ncbi:hypothetical protein ACXIUT_24250 [Achromobacter denitrificans]